MLKAVRPFLFPKLCPVQVVRVLNVHVLPPAYGLLPQPARVRLRCRLEPAHLRDRRREVALAAQLPRAARPARAAVVRRAQRPRVVVLLVVHQLLLLALPPPALLRRLVAGGMGMAEGKQIRARFIPGKRSLLAADGQGPRRRSLGADDALIGAASWAPRLRLRTRLWTRLRSRLRLRLRRRLRFRLAAGRPHVGFVELPQCRSAAPVRAEVLREPVKKPQNTQQE